jgi:Tfp pilus assembly protein PilO
MPRFNIRTSIKHIQIDKANTLILIAATVTTVIVVLSIVASKTLVNQISYQNKVTSLRSKANKQLEANVKSSATLVTAYETFEGSSESAIGTADKNSKIVLDALPSKYDFPALATSLEKVITDSGAKIDSIVGTDDEVLAKQESPDPTPVEMPFSITSTGNFNTAKTLISNLERSIRPIKITSVTFNGSDSSLQTTIVASTYYQPEKKLEIQQKVITNGNTKATK